MPNMSELVNRAKVEQTRRATETRGEYVKPPTREETQTMSMRQKLEEEGVISALEELREMTGDPNARIEITTELDNPNSTDILKKIYHERYGSTHRMTARLVWGEHKGPETLKEKGSTFVTGKGGIILQGRDKDHVMKDVTYEKVQPVKAKSVDVEVALREGGGNESKLLLTPSWAKGLAGSFVQGGREITTGKISTGRVTRREECPHETRTESGY